jgi:two-component system response regulator (stage 0 sporulation protein F)
MMPLVKVLLVEGDQSSGDVIAEFLATAGYEIVLATSPKEAVQKLEACKPIHLIVLDIEMVGQDGFEFLRFLKGLPRHGRIPILVCSTLSDPNVLFRCVELGAQGFVAKPIEEKTFLSKVANVIGSNAGHVLIVDDEEFIRTLLQKIVEREGYRSLLASDGQQALSLLESHNISIIISDIFMPGISGLDLLKKVKEKYASIPVILISGQGGKFGQDDVAKVADGFIAKPFKNVDISRQLQLLSHRPVRD